jgi:hypothetical protein
MPEATRMRFELALLASHGGAAPIALEAVLSGPPAPALRLDDTTLRFEVDGTDLLPQPWVIGNLVALGRQFAAAADRLRDGQVAIVRSAVDDRLDVTSFLFEPIGDDVAVSVFQAPRELRFVYPDSAGRGGELYAYVHEHRDVLAAPPGDEAAAFHGVVVPAAQLIDALDRESDRARRVAALVAS